MKAGTAGVSKGDLNEKEKEMKKKVRGQVREIDRNILKSDSQIKKCELELKKAIQSKKDRAIQTVYAKNVLQAQKGKEKQLAMKGKVQAVEYGLTHAFANIRMGSIMTNAGGLMKDINQLLNIPEMSKTMTEMQMGLEQLGIVNEMVDDNMENLLDEDVDADSKVDDLIDNITQQVQGGPGKKVTIPQNAPNVIAPQNNADDDLESLEAKLASLKS